MRRILYLVLSVTCLIALASAAVSAQLRFQVFFLIVGSEHYLQPQDASLHGFGNLPGANASAELMAELLAKHGAVGGTTLESAAGHYVSADDVKSALKSVTSNIHRHSPMNPLIVVYIASHGISEGVAWNHFSVPGNFVYGAPLDELDVDEMAAHTIYAGYLADELDKLKIPYILLLDSCYWGNSRSFQSPVLTPQAIQNLSNISAVVRFQNEFHTSNPVIFSAQPGKEVPLAPDPRDPDKRSLAPLARRFFLLDRQLSPTGAQVTLSGLVKALASPALDPETSLPVTHAIPPIKDGLVLLASPIGSTDLVTVTGTAIQADQCCGKEGDSGTPIPSQLMRGWLSFEGPAGEFISDGRRVSLSRPGPFIRVLERDPHSIELTFDGPDDWELDLAAPAPDTLSEKTYRGAQRYSFQDADHPGLSLSGSGRACNEVTGEFTITRLTRDSSKRLLRLDATFIQQCDGQAPLRGQVHVEGR